ncbi:MAG: DUF885 domain-containing protein, partial [Sphingomicrobium sp.]
MMNAIARREFLGGAAALGLAGCTTTLAPIGTIGTKRAPSADLLARMAEQILAEYPENGTAMGIDTGARAMLKHRLTDRSAAGRAALASAARSRAAILRTVDISDLSRPAALDTAVALAANE